MPPPNAVDLHPDRDAILAAVESGEQQKDIAARFGVSKFTLSRYVTKLSTRNRYKQLKAQPVTPAIVEVVAEPIAEPQPVATHDLQLLGEVSGLVSQLQVGKTRALDASQFIARASDRRTRAEKRMRVRKLSTQDLVRLGAMARDEDVLAAKLAGILEPSGAAAVTNITINAGAVLMPVVTAPAGRSRIAPVEPAE